MAIAFAASWSSMPGLRMSLLLHDASLHARAVGCALALTSVLFGFPSLRGAAVTSMLTMALQFAAHHIGSLIILPAQGRAFSLLQWILSADLAQRHLPGVIDSLTPIVSSLASVHSALPSARTQLVRSSSGAAPVALTTPDGCILDGALFPATSTGPSRGAILYLGGNGEHYELRADLLGMTRWGYDVLLVNYRGVGRSSGSSTRNGLVIDVCTCIAFLRHTGVAQHAITLLGHSLGGAVAATALTTFPDVNIVADRTFGTLTRTAAFVLARDACVIGVAHSPAAMARRYAVYLLVKYVAMWEMDSVSALLASVAPPRCLSIGIEEDGIIPPGAQLTSMMHEMLQREGRAMPAPVRVMALCPCGDVHDAGHAHLRLRPAAQRGADAHNRGLTRAEMDAVREFIDAAVARGR